MNLSLWDSSILFLIKGKTMTAKIKTNPDFIKVNEILDQFKLKEQFVQKANNTFGIKGTSKYDNKDVIESIKSFVLEAPYNSSIYKTFVDAKLFPRFMVDDLVHWYKQYPPKNNFELNTQRIDRIKRIGSNIMGDIKYLTEEFNHEDGYTPLVGAPYQSYITKCGISPYVKLQTVGKSGDCITELEAERFLELAKQELKTLIIPKDHYVPIERTTTFGGYSLISLSHCFYLDKKDDNSSSFEETNKLSCEIRFHIRSLNEEKLSATLWLNWNNESLKKNIDLFQGDNYKDRFIYADNFKELFEKCISVLNPLISKFTNEDGEVIDYIK